MLEYLGIDIANKKYINLALVAADKDVLGNTVIISETMQSMVLEYFQELIDKSDNEQSSHERCDTANAEKTEKLLFRSESDQVQKKYIETMKFYVENLNIVHKTREDQMSFDEVIEKLTKMMLDMLVIFDDSTIDNISVSVDEAKGIVNAAISQIAVEKKRHNLNSIQNAKGRREAKVETLNFELEGDNLHEKIYVVLLDILSK